MHKIVLLALCFGLFASIEAATIEVPAARDTTLIEDPDGALGNGAGPAVFAGRTNALTGGVRRGLLYFDLNTALAKPGRVVSLEVEKVAVVLSNTTESNVTPREYRLHRLLADWGEGISSSSGGTGAPSAPKDATWLHTFYPDAFWMHNGAQFDGEPSARLVVGGPGTYRFEGDGLLRDVQVWMKDPSRNFGWILIGDETARQTVRAFASREFPDGLLRPVLELTYTESLKISLPLLRR